MTPIKKLLGIQHLTRSYRMSPPSTGHEIAVASENESSWRLLR
ncbi:MAG: hypothetical protein ACR2LZ_03925 [Pyrinomonadaceae bacterium]